MDHLRDDPTFMALSSIQKIEYLQRLNMSESHLNPASASRARMLSGLQCMLENNVPLSYITPRIVDRHLQASVRHDKMDGECIICMREYEKNERIGTLDCRHEFHADCVTDWLLRKNECPLCRATALKRSRSH
ncbi:Zinc finger, RING/FYVE/PHD-type [Artemisia annua]|uniref:RING-type E3 ubiquitin transferase n=1 Tax=Artemisia annua TaxID=35608 RepID=A0A2U1PTK2_ARTAN|nr:Zinc finger, RING/FYVE/PHD-type [Artemisia annua]